MFFTFTQNRTDHPQRDVEAGISTHVVIEATDVAEAHERAEAIGLDFRPADDGCACCGERWGRLTNEAGRPAPLIPAGSAFVHHADGRVVPA